MDWSNWKPTKARIESEHGRRQQSSKLATVLIVVFCVALFGLLVLIAVGVVSLPQ